MLPTASIAFVLLAACSSTIGSPLKSRSPSGPITFINKTPNTINYALVGSRGVIAYGKAEFGGTGFPLPPVGQGYSLKLSTGNPRASSGVLQFEYSLNRDNNTFYDWSAYDGNPDPFVDFNRVISPLRQTNSCIPIYCYPYQADTGCETTRNGQGPIGVCPVFDGEIMTVTID